MAISNYDDVLAQMRAAGLVVDEIEVGRIVRCRVEGDREKRGWYRVGEFQTKDGDWLIGGSFGVWSANDHQPQKIQLSGYQISRTERASLRKRLADDRKRAERIRQAEAERAAQVATAAWAKCEPTGESDYLARKGVSAHGLRFSPSGAVVIPMLDTTGRIHGLQIIRSAAVAKAKRRRQKEYWPRGVVKKGHFHLIGTPTWIVLVAEGYATAASLHEATGMPVAVAFDAGNLAPVAAQLRSRYKLARILICADDDVFAKCLSCKARFILPEHPRSCPECQATHERGNAGVASATTAALECDGGYVVPEFADEAGRREAFIGRGLKASDFNDLHLAEGLHVVRSQVEARLLELGWRARDRERAAGATGGGGNDALTPIAGLDALLDRFCLVYGQGGAVFDRQEHCLLTLSDMRDACITRYVHRAWMEHPDRRIVRPREVGFDPGGVDPQITCNLWGGWDGEPRSGCCERLLELLRYMCSGDTADTYEWVLNWIAYPIQHPGAKLKTTLVIHGPQGTGKNLFFEALMTIYGRYGRVIDQSAIEDRFNDWASRKLFLLADEVVARSDLYHVKNKLKAFITGDWIRINPKNMAAYDERNHANVVFLSNEPMPVVLEEDDRRHAVIWTPAQLGKEFYASVAREIQDGGIPALHHYLLHHDCGNFGPSTEPPATAAKDELIDLSLDSTSRFFYALDSGEIDGVTARPARSTDVYDLYKTWCSRIGYRPAPQPKLLNAFERKHFTPALRKRYVDGAETKGPHSIVMLGKAELPPGTSEPLWLGEHIQQFRTAVKDYRGASYG